MRRGRSSDDPPFVFIAFPALLPSFSFFDEWPFSRPVPAPQLFSACADLLDFLPFFID